MEYNKAYLLLLAAYFDVLVMKGHKWYSLKKHGDLYVIFEI